MTNKENIMEKVTLELTLEELIFMRDALWFYENDSGRYDEKLGGPIFSQFPEGIIT